ncbi:hypothetical protein GCM10023264_16500 [Sphingomonas daechungensis]|uniref:DUF4402 domain-containing protein n=1 Tax=Sphingomonas daechungensis TaxID=1176646 RepID=UPI0031F0A1BD
MLARTALFAVGLAAAALLAAIPDARAQCRLCDKPVTAPRADSSGEIIELQIEASLDFDRLVVLGDGEGTATLLPNGTRQTSGSVEAMGGRAMVGEAHIRGEPGRSVRIDMPSRLQLHSMGGGRITIDEIVTDLPGDPRLDSRGILNFRFGGRIRFNGSNDGDFRGELPITVEYP